MNRIITYKSKAYLLPNGELRIEVYNDKLNLYHEVSIQNEWNNANTFAIVVRDVIDRCTRELDQEIINSLTKK